LPIDDAPYGFITLLNWMQKKDIPLSRGVFETALVRGLDGTRINSINMMDGKRGPVKVFKIISYGNNCYFFTFTTFTPFTTSLAG